MSKKINIAGKQVKVFVKPSRKAEKTVKVEIKSENEITVEIPEGVKVKTDILLDKYRGLLEKKYIQFLHKKPILKDNSILYKGKYYQLDFKEVEKNPEKQVILGKNELKLFHEPRSDPYRILKKWMTNETKQLVDEIKQKYIDALGDPLVMRVADTTRWGYTRKNGVIVINSQLAALPPELSEYVIVHELAHLSKMNHQKKFHYKLAQIIPDYKQKEKALQEYLNKNCMNARAIQF